MENNDKFASVFMDVLGVGEDDLEDLEYHGTENWDSVGHMSLISELEDRFDIMMDTDDIIGFSSYKKGREILSTKYDVEF